MPRMPEGDLVHFGQFNAILKEHSQGDILRFNLAKGVGNSTVREGLAAFGRGGMESASAARHLLQLFAPVEFSEETTGMLKQPDGKAPKNLWDQIGPAYTRKDLRDAHKNDLIATNYSLLESLASQTQELHIHGKTRPLSKEAVQQAQNIFDRYSQWAADTLDPEDPLSVKMVRTAQLSPVAVLAAACAAGPVAPTIDANPPAIVSEMPTPSRSGKKKRRNEDKPPRKHTRGEEDKKKE